MATLQDWTSALAAELGVEAPTDIDLLLDLARRAAHGVDRPAAPLTTFLVGYAAGRSGEPTAVADAVRTTSALIDAWSADPPVPSPLGGS